MTTLHRRSLSPFEVKGWETPEARSSSGLHCLQIT